MIVNETAVETGRGSYESFDCAQAVALIGFIGLISNFQDIIDEFTTLLNNGRRKRDTSSWLLSHLPGRNSQWDGFLLSSMMKALQWDADQSPGSRMNYEEGRKQQTEKWMETDEEEYMKEDLTRGSQDTKTKPPTGTTTTTPSSLLSNLAHAAPKLAMWVVDTGDGRVSGEVGRKGVCHTANTLTQQHGWLGSLATNLIMNTMASAVSKHQPARTRLNLAGLSRGTPTC